MMLTALRLTIALLVFLAKKPESGHDSGLLR